MVSKSESIDVGQVSINCGIFQGDSLSPLLFCIALNPLSRELRNLTPVTSPLVEMYDLTIAFTWMI